MKKPYTIPGLSPGMNINFYIYLVILNSITAIQPHFFSGTTPLGILQGANETKLLLTTTEFLLIY